LAATNTKPISFAATSHQAAQPLRKKNFAQNKKRRFGSGTTDYEAA
jgi:hypothetical protein